MIDVPRIARRSARRLGGRCYSTLYAWGPVLALVGVISAVVAAIRPTDATAAGIPLVPDAIDPVTAIGNAVGNTITKGFEDILNFLFGGIQAELSLAVLRWLTSINADTQGRVHELYKLTSGMSFGLLGAVMTVAVLRYYIAGLSQSGSGGYEAIEGFTRTIGAVLLILAWPFLFKELIALVNAASAAVLSAPSVRADLATLFRAAIVGKFSIGPIGAFLSIITVVAGSLLFMGLILLKITLAVTTVVLYVAMPLAIILWPVSELSWIVRYVGKLFVTVLIIPVAWAILFATFAAVSVNAITFQGGGDFLEKLIQPLVGISLLMLAVGMPKALVGLAKITAGGGGGGGGFVGRAGSFMFARQAESFLGAQGMLPYGQGNTGFMQGSARAAQGAAAVGSSAVMQTRMAHPSGGVSATVSTPANSGLTPAAQAAQHVAAVQDMQEQGFAVDKGKGKDAAPSAPPAPGNHLGAANWREAGPVPTRTDVSKDHVPTHNGAPRTGTATEPVTSWQPTSGSNPYGKVSPETKAVMDHMDKNLSGTTAQQFGEVYSRQTPAVQEAVQQRMANSRPNKELGTATSNEQAALTLASAATSPANTVQMSQDLMVMGAGIKNGSADSFLASATSGSGGAGVAGHSPAPSGGTASPPPAPAAPSSPAQPRATPTQSNTVPSQRPPSKPQP